MRRKGQHLFCAGTTVVWCGFMLFNMDDHKAANIVGVAVGAAVMYAILFFLVKQFGLHKKRK